MIYLQEAESVECVERENRECGGFPLAVRFDPGRGVPWLGMAVSGQYKGDYDIANSRDISIEKEHDRESLIF